MVRCPVCGMEFDEDTALELGAVVEEVDDRRLYFCGRYCRDEFFRQRAGSADGRADDADGPQLPKDPAS